MPPKKAFALSRTLVADLGVERADAVAAALLDQTDLATDALLFAIAGTVLGDRMSFTNIALQCRPPERGHSRPEARDAATLRGDRGASSAASTLPGWTTASPKVSASQPFVRLDACDERQASSPGASAP